jgi:hypothetical protein
MSGFSRQGFRLAALVIPQDRVEIDYSAPIHDVFLAVVHRTLQTDREDHTGLQPETMHKGYVKHFLHQLARSLSFTFSQVEIDKTGGLHLIVEGFQEQTDLAWLSHHLREALFEHV